MNIRAATINDLPCLADLLQEYQVILTQSDPRLAALLTADRGGVGLLNRRIVSLDGSLLLAEVACGDIGGFIVGHIRDDQIGVVELLVLDAHRYHGGVGRQLWLGLRDWFLAQHVKRIIISVPRYYTVHQAFWRALGAVEWTNEACPPGMMWMTW